MVFMILHESESTISHMTKEHAKYDLRDQLLRFNGEIPFDNSKIQQAEVCRDTGEGTSGVLSARIYFAQQPTHIPTLVLGHLQPVGRAAHADNRPIYPLNGRQISIFQMPSW